MHRQTLLRTLTTYEQVWTQAPYPGASPAEEATIIASFRGFVGGTPSCFERASAAGHVTGSALVVAPDLEQVLLTLHGKLGLWLQLGGHADGDPRPDVVARREAAEESGLKDLHFLEYEERLPQPVAGGSSPLPFDLDRHVIPGRGDEPGHLHFDVRYLLVANPAEPLVITNESRDLRWFRLADARRVTRERSMQRQFDKLIWLHQVVDRPG